MTAPLTIGGIVVPLHAGAPEVSYTPAGGYADLTMSDGRPLRMRHWKKEIITVSGSGWVGTGLDALDWDAQHLLLCPVPKRITVAGLSATLTSDARPDVPVTVHALLGDEWVPTTHTRTGRAVTITPVSGATGYSVSWYPQFTVLVTPPTDQYAGAEAQWQLICREV